MKKYSFILAAFLGALGIGLFWFGGFIENLKETSHAAGKAECMAEYADKKVKVAEKRKKVQNVQIRKEAIVWSRPNSRLPALIERMRADGIGTIDNSENCGLSARR